ncbi:polysaccharide deacetylase family protein [Micromonospora sp. NPDC049679]|uniref:polysaccharide deacetylase family protein n=1 Tax=Micromonospora sp. NPDC049679 TaxID=3155920 RepID=UPI0033DDF3E9
MLLRHLRPRHPRPTATPTRFRRLAAVITVVIAGALAGGASPAAPHSRGGAPSATPAAPSSPGGPGNSRGVPGDDSGATPLEEGLPDGPSPRPADAGPSRDILARIPTFPAAPPPQPITLPAGASAPWLTHIPTTQPVAFITIDDGWVKHPQAFALIRAAQVPVTLFLTVNAIQDDPGHFARLQAAGAVIEAHTISHPNLRGRSYDFQRREICGSADRLGAMYGRRPVLFRPPFGEQDPTTLRAVRDCGMRAAFFWKETVNNGVVRYQVGRKVQCGDIILMHFRPAFVADFLAALQAIHDAGLTPALLADYLPDGPEPAIPSSPVSAPPGRDLPASSISGDQRN